MKITFLGIAIAMLLLSSQSLIAQVGLDDPDVAATIRTKYDKSSDLPDGVAFLWTMRTVSFLNSLGDGSAAAWLQGEMGIPEADAQQFVAQMLKTLESFENDKDKFSRHLACRPLEPRAFGNDIYPIFEAMDDADGNLARKHLALIKAEIGRENAARLQLMLNSNKLVITHVTFRHQEHYKQTGANPDEVLDNICKRLNQTRQGKPK